METTERDPRVRRTRQLLQDGLEKLLKEKDFSEISVQDIAEAATLNRATFYDHYPDKSALLQCLVAGRFRRLLQERNITFEGCDTAIRSMALGVCTYLTEMPGACARTQRDSGQLLELAIGGVVQEMVLDGLKSHHAVPVKDLSLDTLASTVAWAIYGAAKEWVRRPKRASPERMARTIDALVAPIMAAGLASGVR